MAHLGISAAWAVGMVSIGKLAAGQADYYLEQAGRRIDRSRSIGSGVEDYYLGGPEDAGVWMGAGAVSLGLAGTVADQELRSILDGREPASGELLPRRALRVPGFDVTFSAPKSVSILYGLGDDGVRAATRLAHDAAVREAFGYLERQAAFARRGHGGNELVPGEGLIAAGFVHRTSRAGDPQLHTHVLIANLTRASDGVWRALDGRRLYAHARTAGFLYEYRLRSELRLRLGVTWGRPRNGIADIDGIERPVLRAFSRRRAEIEAELQRLGLDSAAAAEVAALQTRRRKNYDVTPEDLLPEWRQRAAALGLDASVIDRTVLGRVSGRRDVEPAAGEAMVARQAGPEGLTHSRSSFSRRDAIQAWCEELPSGSDLSVQEVEAGVDAMLASDAFVPLLDGESASSDAIRLRDGRLVTSKYGEQRFSTPELLALERRIVEVAVTPADAPRARPAAVDAAIQRRPSLAGEQALMVRRLTLDSGRVAVVVGKAGTGKTFALDAARAAWEESGIRVLGAAVARRAARELEEGAGIVSTSVAALLADMRRGGAFALPRGCVVVVDEASLVPTRQLAEVLEHVVHAEAKLVLVGDHRQLPAIQAGGAFRGLVLRLGAIELEQNRRQDAAWERAALDQLRAGQVPDAVRAYAANDRLVVAENAATIRQAIVRDWWADGRPGDALMIAFRRADVADLNARARAELVQAGAVGSAIVNHAGVDFAAGDRVVLRRNDRRLGVANGDRAVVTDADPVRGALGIALRGRRVRLDRTYLDSASNRPAISHGYAVTGHIAQGMTVDRALVLGTDTLSQEWGYVALSRGRHENRFYAIVGAGTERDEYAPTPPGREPLEEIAHALERSQAQLLGLDVAAGSDLSALSTQRLGDELQRLRSSGASRLAAAARRARTIELALTELAPTQSDQMTTRLAASRRALLGEELAELRTELALFDVAPGVRLALVEEELARRGRLTAAGRTLDPGPDLIARLGPRPDHPSDAQRWRRHVMQLGRHATRGVAERFKGRRIRSNDAGTRSTYRDV